MYSKYQNFYITIVSLIFLTLLIFINTAQAENLIFTEIMYNPEGNDADQEWLEIFNLSTSTIEINSNWRFNDGSNHLLNIYQGENQIASTSFFIITANAQNFLNNYPNFNQTIFESSLSLNNSSDTIQLLNNEELITEMTYTSELGANGNNKTLEKIDIYNPESSWQESYVSQGTPGNESSTPPPNQAPIAIAGDDLNIYTNEEIILDASNSYDPDDDLLTFLWNISDLTISTSSITTYQFSEAGTYLIDLIVSDNQASSTDSLMINVTEEIIDPPTIINNIIINEILPNPIGSDEAEWIELKNENDEIIHLLDCYLEDASGNKYYFNSTDYINHYFVLERSVSGISLNNYGETLSLFNNFNEKIDEINYSSSQENKSWARFDNQWKQTSILTKGSENQEDIYYPPLAIINLKSDDLVVNQEIILDATDSEDPQESDLKYQWYLNNSLEDEEEELEIIFTEPGLKKIKLKVTNEYDLENETIIYLYIANNKQNTSSEPSSCSDTNQKIIINEILPNPAGSDNAEWIELYNPNNKKINLNNWSINDAVSSFQLEYSIPAQSYLLIPREDSKIALNNSNEELKLLDCDNNLINELSYSKSFEDQSYAYNSNDEKYYWTENITPEEKNIFSSDDSLLFEEQNSSENMEVNFVEISEVKDLEEKTEVLISGIIISLAHEIHKNTAYVCYYNSENKLDDLNDCVAVYLNQQWPSLNYGDFVQVKGTINHLKNYSRLKIKTPNNIILIKENISFDIPEYYLEEIGEEMIDSLISVSAEISKLNKKSFYIQEDENELKIKINNNKIKLDDFTKNDFIIINGFLTQYSDDLILIPRNQDDLIKSKILGDKKEEKIVSSTKIINLNEEEKKSNTTNWLLGSGIVTSLGFIFKNKFIQLLKK